MPSLEIVDDVLAPDEAIVITYKGDNPMKVCKMIRDWLRRVFMVETKDIYERIFKVSKVEEPRGFYNMWHVEKSEDKWTKVFCKVVIDGYQDTKTKKGKVRIEITAWIRTKYTYSNFLQRAFWLIFNRILYYKRRRAYIEKGRMYVEALKDEIYKELGIPKLE